LKEYSEQNPLLFDGDWGNIPHNRLLLIAFVAIVEFALFIGGIYLAVWCYLGKRYAIVKYNYLLMAILLSCFGKPFFLLTIIWNYPIQFVSLLNIFILASNVVAIKVFLDCGVLVASLIVTIGVTGQALLQLVIYYLEPTMAVTML